MICLTLMESSIESNLKVLEKNRHLIDMAELRLDMLSDPLIVSPDIIKSVFGTLSTWNIVGLEAKPLVFSDLLLSLNVFTAFTLFITSGINFNSFGGQSLR